MRNARKLVAALLVSLLALGACQVTEEKIERWKGTQNGPKKLAGTLIDPEVETELRARAGVALVEINEWKLFRESFKKMERADAQEVIKAIAPKLGKIVESAGETISREQIDAKDGLFMMVEFAESEALAALRKPLVHWCTRGDYNKRAMAGNHNAKTIVEKLGPPAAEAMIDILKMDNPTIEHVAKLIREAGDEEVFEKASAHWAEQLKSNVSSIGELHLVVAAIIGGEAIAGTLIELATNKNLNAELQRFALRAFSMALDNEHIEASDERLQKLLEMAENDEYDKFQREETYLTISQAGGEEQVDQVAQLLEKEDFFWRLVGLRCLLRMDGENQLARVLATDDLATSGQQINDVILWVARFPKLLPQVREVAQKGEPFARGVAIYVMGVIGKKEEVALLKKLAGSKKKLPRGFEHKSVGEAAKAVLADFEKKG